MKRIKKRTFAGVVCEQEVFTVSDQTNVLKKAEKRLRFKTEEERMQHRLGISRRKNAKIINQNFDPDSLYSTLTFDNAHEVHTFQEADRVFNKFRRTLKSKYQNAVIYWVKGRGENTERIHFHMISKGIQKEAIEELWKYGMVTRNVNLRKNCRYDGVDYGPDYTGLANYLFDHWTPEQGGHRWHITKNAAMPESEEPVEAKVNYSKERPPRAPKGYVLVEVKATKFGYLYFKYIKGTKPVPVKDLSEDCQSESGGHHEGAAKRETRRK